MSNSFGYRSAKPDLSSSSPLANLHDLSSSEPISPGSPTPTFKRSLGSGSTTATFTSLDSSSGVSVGGSSQTKRTNAFLLSPNNSRPDPFSGNAKASPNSHPSFGKDQLRAKHLRNSPNTSSLLGEGSSGNANLWNRDDEILRQHFHDSSDDHPSSDDVGPHNFITNGTLNNSTQTSSAPYWSGTGLGIRDESSALGYNQKSSLLGAAFQEPTSPTLGKKPRARTFERTQSSSHDPFSAIGGSSIRPPQDAVGRTKANEGSPRSQVIRQRRRLAGSSPKQLTRVTGKPSNRQWNESESESDEQNCSWERKISGSYFKQVQQENEVGIRDKVAQVMENQEHVLNLSELGLTNIDPVIADLANYVRIPNLRRDDDDTRSGLMSRTSSFANNSQERFGVDSPMNSPSRTRLNNQSASGSGNSNKLELYLAHNLLKTLSSPLFLVTNLTVLSVRGNKLTELPAAIGQLIKLTELNVAQNELRYFPSEIQQLNLTKFVFFPNTHLLKPPKDARLSIRKPFGVWNDLKSTEEEEQQRSQASIPPPGSMGPPAIPNRNRSFARLPSQHSFSSGFHHVDQGSGKIEDRDSLIARTLETQETVISKLPSLGESCIRALLQLDRGQNSQGDSTQRFTNNNRESNESNKIMLDRYEAGSISNLSGGIDGNHIKVLESARRSAKGGWDHVRFKNSESWYSDAEDVRIVKQDSNFSQQGRPSQFINKSFNSYALQDSDDLMSSEGEGDGGEASGEWSCSDEEKKTVTDNRIVDVIEELNKGDDSMQNPWFNRCPNPHHHAQITSNNVNSSENHHSDWPQNDPNRIFSQPCVQRIEWVSHIGGCKVIEKSTFNEALAAKRVNSKDEDKSTSIDKRPLAQDSNCLPILWRGCMRGCLDFLNQDVPST